MVNNKYIALCLIFDHGIYRVYIWCLCHLKITLEIVRAMSEGKMCVKQIKLLSKIAIPSSVFDMMMHLFYVFLNTVFNNIIFKCAQCMLLC